LLYLLADVLVLAALTGLGTIDMPIALAVSDVTLKSLTSSNPSMLIALAALGAVAVAAALLCYDTDLLTIHQASYRHQYPDAVA
jgi:hypothetical protein